MSWFIIALEYWIINHFKHVPIFVHYLHLIAFLRDAFFTSRFLQYLGQMLWNLIEAIMDQVSFLNLDNVQALYKFTLRCRFFRRCLFFEWSSRFLFFRISLLCRIHTTERRTERPSFLLPMRFKMVEVLFVAFNITCITTFTDRTQSIRLINVKVAIIYASLLL